MKFSQAIKLGHRSLAGHKRRNLTTIIIIGVMFGFLMGIIFLTQGAQNAIMHAADAALGESYYLRIQTNFYNKNLCYYEPVPDSPNQFNIICKPVDDAALAKHIQSMGGELLAISHDRSFTLTPEAAQPFLQTDLASIPETAVPMLKSDTLAFYDLLGEQSYKLNYQSQAKLIREGKLQEVIGRSNKMIGWDGEDVVVGITPSGTIHQLTEGTVSLDPLDYILEFLGMDSGSGGALVIDNNSPSTQAYLEYANSFDPVAENMVEALLKFDNFDQAMAFARSNTCQVYESSMGCKKDFFLETIPDNRISIARTAQMVWWGLGIAETVFIVIAVTIALFTLLKVLHGESKNIALYRSLGASTSDMVKIYLAYTLEVCLFAVGLAVAIGLIMAIFISFIDMSDMADLLTVAYNKVIDGPLILVGWNFDLLKIIIVMVCVAPLSLLFSTKILRKDHHTK